MAAEGTLTVTGDIQATGRFSMATCPDTRLAEDVGFQETLPFHNGSTVYYLEFTGLSPGRLSFDGAWRSYPYQPQRLRFSAPSGSDFLNWGVDATGAGQVTGELLTTMDRKSSGSFALDLGFTGSDSGAIAATTHGPVHIAGSWNCRPFVAGDGSLSITGDFAVTAPFSASACDETYPTEGALYFRADYQTPPAGLATPRFVVFLIGVKEGTASYPNDAYPPGILSVEVETAPGSKEFIHWGRNRFTEPAASGTVTVADPAAKAGSFDLVLPFNGNDRGTVDLSSHGPIHATGSWRCP